MTTTAEAAVAPQEREAAVRCTYLPDRGLECVAFPIPATTRARREHGRAIALDPSWTRALPEHKTTDYEICRRALERAVAAGADEALFVTPDGHVLEGTATNVFAVRGTTLITAPAGVLPGIVRAWVLAHAPRLGLSIEERAPSAAEVREGAFFTGSLTGIAPVRVLDGEPCADASEVVAVLREF
jgi:branched-subunit amino acid aminotransferase/4-amino-4-deoxychorismate lyase